MEVGLKRRLETAGAAIAWRPAPGARGAGDRIAHLNDEEARVHLAERGGSVALSVDPGPLGALVLLLEIGRRGGPDRLEGWDRGPPPFERGGLRAIWGDVPATAEARPVPVADLLGVARYALP